MRQISALAWQTQLNLMQSSDLLAAGFYLWDCLNGNVYQGRPQSIHDFRTAVTKSVQSLQPNMLFSNSGVFSNPN